ncbi:GNAT family N-acetyltransferase [uncultured Croceitalea sp.]|uniref:GNAT family N-acetyltransferase n=1 Tax=uncultured Croceitalea sp. TaxID=1798908 RepID=UPI0033058EEF
MNISIKSFNELSTKELYQILQLRSEVFVVEQNCVYQDVDDKDQKALHVLGFKNDNLAAYTRIFKPGDYYKNTSIGRVVVKKPERKYGFGKDIMLASLKTIKEEIGGVIVELSAQVYLKRFYKDLGFVETGKEYLEDGIPHIRMLKTPN